MTNLLKDSSKLAIEYESAFAWVKKTVDWTAQEFAKLDNNLKTFYKQFNFKKGPIINDFIDFLLNMKSGVMNDN